MERRSTNVELPWRSVSGSTPSACESEAFSVAIAPIMPLRFVISDVSCGALCAIAPVTLAPATIARVERRLVARDLLHELVGRRQERVEVLGRQR